MPEKTVILGIDGASPAIFRMLKMKFSDMAATRGYAGEIRNASSEDRGWATLLTGGDASHHGGFYWIPAQGGYSVSDSFCSTDYKAEPLWTTLSAKGLSQGYLSVPTTFPPPSVNGFFVSGAGGGRFPALKDAVYPTGFIEENAGLFENYISDCRYRSYRDFPPSRIVNELTKAAKIRSSVTSSLISKYDPDLFMTVFVGPDRLQHYFWPILLGESPRGLPSLRSEILAYYRTLDEELTALVDRYSGERNIIFVSDHGFAGHTHDLRINRILVNMGFAEAKKNPLRKYLVSAARKLLPRGIKARIKKGKAGGQSVSVSCLEWSRTYAFGNMARGVFLNRKDAFPCGVVDNAEYEKLREKVMLGLEAVANPINGERLFSKVSRREDIYRGPLAHLAPDIILEADDGHKFVNDIDKKDILSPAAMTKFHRSRLPGTVSGIHGSPGFFGAIGPGIKKPGNKELSLSSLHFRPFVCSLLGLGKEDMGDFVHMLP